MTPGDPRPEDAELWASVEATVRDLLLPDLTDDWARAAAVQLVGLARYAQQRPADTSAQQAAELATALDSLAQNGNEIVADIWPGQERSVHDAVARCLVAAVPREDPAAEEVRSQLRPIVVRQLDAELAATAPLLDFFRGRLPDA